MAKVTSPSALTNSKEFRSAQIQLTRARQQPASVPAPITWEDTTGAWADAAQAWQDPAYAAWLDTINKWTDAAKEWQEPDYTTWLDAPDKWVDAAKEWHEPNYATWLDTINKWTDAAQEWDTAASSTSNAPGTPGTEGSPTFIRAAQKIRNKPTGAYINTANKTREAAALWHMLTAAQRQEWATTAAARNASAYVVVIDPRTGAPRFGKPRRDNGYSAFTADYQDAPGATPKQPSDPTRQGPPAMTELLTGEMYEQRMLQALATTDGPLTIAMYQVSPRWSQPGIAASELFTKLLAQPTRRSACRLILATPPGGTTLQGLNAQAAALMTAAGWLVRRTPAYPVMHAKLWLIERGTLYAGSHNLSNRATTANQEAGLLTTSARAVNDAREWIEGLWNAAS